MAHGYLGDGYGSHGEIDPDRSDNSDRERDRDWSERDWRGRDHDWQSRNQNRDRSLMFGDRERGAWSDDDRWSRRGGWQGSDWQPTQGDRQSERSSNSDPRWNSPSTEAPRGYSSNPDDHYRSWRDRQMSALDQDYADYCQEREQQFHREFDDWRRRRQNQKNSRNDEVAVAADEERTHERAMSEGGNSPSPIGVATIGTNNSENAATGRGGRGRS
jgi:hypothetical protein